MAKKPPFNPNKPFVPATDAAAKPAFNPNKQFERVTDETGHIDDFSALPAAKRVDNLEPILNEIVRTSVKDGGVTDAEKDILRDLLKNPNTTGQQAKEAIQTIQGYHPKNKDNNDGIIRYYLKKEDNGVTVPIPLAYGERPPEGYDAASVWGNPKQAKDDSWYTDVAKTLVNGLAEGAKGVFGLAQLGVNAVTDEDSKYLNELTNAAERLKFTKDEDLNKPIYNTEGVTKFADLVSKERFDISPESIWGTVNMVGESVIPFFMGAGAATRGIQAVTGAEKLGKAGQLGATYVGSVLSMTSDNLDHARAAGLTGRDAASVAGLTTAVQGVIETAFGLPPQIFKKTLPTQEASQLIGRLVAGVEKDAEGKITEAGFKQLAKELATSYSEVAKRSVGKEFVKDVAKEGFTEGSQDFVAKSAEQLWDKLSDEDKAKFGTDITSPQAFASYMQNIAAGMAGGAPMAGVNSMLTNYKKQSETAFSVVNGGEGRIKEFKDNINQQFRQGELTEKQRDEALFKIDAYDKYNKQVSDLPNITEQEKKEAFELSFNIEALKKEIDIPKEDLDKLDPIAIAKIDSKKTLISGLQKELNTILLKQDIQTETKVGEDTKNKMAKDLGIEPKTDKDGNKKPTTLDDVLAKVKSMPAPETKVVPKISDYTNEQWVKMSKNDPMNTKRVVQNALKEMPNNEMEVTIHSDKNGRYVFMVDEGKPVRFGQSVKGREDSVTPDYFKRENLPATKIFIEDKGGDPNPDNQGEPEHYFKEKAIVKRVEFEGTNAKTGEPQIKAVLPVYNAKTGAFIGFAKESNVGKSKYDTREEKSHLRHIIDSNLFDGSLKGYEYNATERAKVPNFKYRTVEEFVDDYVGGKMKGTPEEQEFYLNNADAIEAELAALAEAEKPKEEPAKPDAKKADIERRRQEVERISKLPFQERIPALIKTGIIDSTISTKMGVRFPIIININGVKVPFYRSSNGTDGKTKGSWNPFFGFGKGKNGDSWLIKGDNTQFKNYYNSKAIEEYSKLLDSVLNWDTEVDKVRGVKNHPFMNMLEQVSLEEFNEKVYNTKDLNIINGTSGETNPLIYVDNRIKEINAKYDAELKELESTELTPAEAKKADIERKRQEELNQESYRIPVSKETRTWTDDDGTKFETTITTFKDGSKQATNKNLETQGVTPISKYNKDLSNEKIYELEAPNAIERGEIKQQQVQEAKIVDKINAIYDAELAALEQQRDKPEPKVEGKPKEKVKKEVNVTKPEVRNYTKPEDNNYRPENQLKFNQGEYYEPVVLVADNRLIDLVQIGSAISSNLRKGTKKFINKELRERLEKTFGINAIDAYENVKLIAKENRDKNISKIVVFDLASLKAGKLIIEEGASPANKPVGKEAKTDVIAIRKITTDEKRFQNRGELNQDVVNNIAENFDLNQFDPIVVWEEGDKTLVLAGHHRLEGAKKAGVNSVPVRYFEGNEKQAIEYAKELSNANRSMETVVERANIYREKLKKGESKKSVEEQAKKTEGKNATFILNVAALSPDGIAIQTFESFKNSEDKATQLQVNKVMDWVGSVRRQYPELTDQHEKELFDFLMDKDSSKRFTTIADFKQKVTTIVGGFDFDATKPLNIARFKNKSQGEVEYDSQVEDLKAKINEVEKKIETLRARFKDPKSEGYISPETADYQQLKGLADRTIDKLNIEYQKLNKDLLDLYRNKGKFVNAGSNQGALFQKESARKADFQKVFDRIKKVMPKVNVVVDATIVDGQGNPVAGQVQGNTLKINPDYAGADTPIHEAGHILIDAIGYKNRVIQKAISQLKDTDLWKETKERYELSEEMLGKEVLAEAIGREGADVFTTQAAKSKFKAILDYLFDKLKNLFGINKNVAKSLAKQIISGIGTKNLEGKNDIAQLQKPKKGKKELSPEDAKAKEIMDDIAERGMSEIPYEELVDIYNAISTSDVSRKGTYQAELERRIGLNLKERGLQNAQKEVSEGTLKFKDIGWFDKWFKVLSWFDEKFPEMKELSKMWNTAFFNKMKEARSEKNTHDKLAEAVVKERNNKLGIVEKGKSLLSNRAYKSFEYLDNGKGQLITLDEAKAKGLSDAQIKYLKYVRDLIAKRQEIGADGDVYNTEMDVIKLDKGFSEAFQSDGFVAAVGSFFGNNNDLLATEITFTNPNTGREQRARFADVQTILTKYGEKGLKEKAKATMLMVKYGREAKYALRNRMDEGEVKKGRTHRIIVDEKGNLLSRFGGERIQGRAYSKDFYNAITQYIDDSAHIKHISPLVPIINSIELLADKGAIVEKEILAQPKANLTQWMDMWIKQQVLRKPDENDPTLDAAIKALRFATSGIAMWFKVSANAMNVAIGNYMNFWKEGGATWWKGNKRLFGNLKYSAAILNKYVAVSNDIDSNPFVGVKNKLAALGYIGQKYGEWQIQGSGLLGLMSDEDYNSFEFKKNQYGVEELVIKDMPEAKKKALEDRILALMDRVSDVQGKYSPKDRMNIMNNEFGKIAMQFKVWIPAWVHSRFGDEGSYKIAYRNFLKDGLKELRTDLKSKGFIKTYKTNKAFAQNLRGALTIGFLMSLAYQDDDDKEKSDASEFAQKALHDVLFIFDPENLKYTLTHPVAITGTIEKFINAFEHLIYLEEYKGDSKYGDKGDLKIQGDILSATPAGNVMEIVDSVTEEE